eukprot:Em0011g699a
MRSRSALSGSPPPTPPTATASRLSVTGLFLALNRPLQCNGTLAAWQYCYRATNGSAQITFQIWRPNGTAAYSRRHSTSLNKTFSTASGAVVCERVVASTQVTVQPSDVIGVLLPFSSANLSVGVFSPNGSVSTVRYIPASSTNSAQLSNNTNVTLTQLNSSLNASLMVYVELLDIATSSTGSSTAIRSTASTTVSTANRSASSSIKTSVPTLAPSWSSAATYLSSSPPPYVARSDNSAQIVAAASASSIIGVFVVVCVIVAVVVAALWLIRSRKSKSSTRHHPPTDNPTYDTADSPKTANKYFDASNLVKQISGKSLTVSSNEQSRPNTPRRQTESRYLSLTVIATSELPEYEKDGYRDPSDDIDEILLQLVDLNIPLLTKEDITVQSLSRSGQFSAVSKAVWKNGEHRYQVAIKSATVQTQVKEHTLMLQEAAIMGQFIHPNIVSIYGVVNERHSAMLVIEHMQQGDLDTFLKTLTPDYVTQAICVKRHHTCVTPACHYTSVTPACHYTSVAPACHYTSVTPGLLKGNSSQSTSGLLLGFCQQIALAIHYLSSRDFVHCDLAARSVFVSEDNICKVGEFGMSKRLAARRGHAPTQGRDQVRWMSPESLDSNEYTSRSDAWSYGCLLYEIWSLGKMPYEDCTDTEVAEKISSGWRLPPPPGCPRHIYKIMVECWNPEPTSRPSFRDILASLTQDHTQIMTIPREDARSHPKATTLGGHLQAGRGMYGDLQSSYASGADDQGAQANDSIYENVMPAWHNGEAVEPVRHGTRSLREPGGSGEGSATETRNDSAAGELYEGMNDAAPQEVGSTEPGEFYEGMDSSVTEGVYDSVSVHEEEPTYDVVHDTKVD